jgi:hypothetical protein
MFEAYRRMLAQYGKCCVAQKNLYKWVDKLNIGGQLLMMMNDQASLQHHEQIATMCNWTIICLDH